MSEWTPYHEFRKLTDPPPWGQGLDIEPTYEIVRFRQHGDSEVLESGVSLEDAQAWCNRDDTRGDGWFDGYRREEER